MIAGCFVVLILDWYRIFGFLLYSINYKQMKREDFDYTFTFGVEPLVNWTSSATAATTEEVDAGNKGGDLPDLVILIIPEVDIANFILQSSPWRVIIVVLSIIKIKKIKNYLFLPSYSPSGSRFRFLLRSFTSAVLLVNTKMI